MKIKKFRAADSQQALRQIREEIGPDAAILACYAVPDGIEFLVTSEPVSMETAVTQRSRSPVELAPGVTPHPAFAMRRNIDTLMDTRAAAAEPAVTSSAAVEVARVDADLISLRSELGSMRNLLESHLQLVARQQPAAAASTLSAALMAALEAAPGDLPMQPMAQRLADALPVRALPQAGVIAFVGPAGAGKTSLLARLATQLALAGGGEQIALISTDAGRIGAQEQLKAYGRLLQVPVHVAHDARSLSYLLTLLQRKTWVLIDTAGIASHDEQGRAELAELLAACPQAEVILTLPADAAADVQDAVASAFAPLPLTGLALTRLDEARRLDASLAVAIRQRLPLTWCSHDATQPQAVQAADADALVAGVCLQAGIPMITEQDAGLRATA